MEPTLSSIDSLSQLQAIITAGLAKQDQGCVPRITSYNVCYTKLLRKENRRQGLR